MTSLDATCTDTFCASNIARTSSEPGHAAAHAKSEKLKTYSYLCIGHIVLFLLEGRPLACLAHKLMPSSRDLVGASGMYLETNCPTPTLCNGSLLPSMQRGNAFHEAGLYSTIDFHWGGELGYIRRLYVVIHACLKVIIIIIIIIIITIIM